MIDVIYLRNGMNLDMHRKTETVLLNSMGNGVIFREQTSFADDHHINKMKLPSYLNRCMIFTLTLLSAV